MYIPQDNVRQPLYVITPIFNPIRSKSRWKLYRDFAKRVRDAGAVLITIEAAFGERDFSLEAHAQEHNDIARDEIGEWRSHGPAPIAGGASMPHSRKFQEYVKIRVGQQSELWLKENLMNLALMHLPEDAKYVAFIDADTAFVRPDWVSETVHALQHFAVIQMFSTVVEQSPTYNPHQMHRGFMFSWFNKYGSKFQGGGHHHHYPGGPSHHRICSTDWHPGYAWAWRVSALDAVGGLVDWGILGAGDRHMACALVGRVADSYPKRPLHPKYRERCEQWQRRAVQHLKFNVGYIDGTLIHYWHGRKVNRRYADRWQILVDHQFNPETDMKRDRRGVIMLSDRKPRLRDDIRRYFRARDEDSNYMPEEDDKLLGPGPIPR